MKTKSKCIILSLTVVIYIFYACSKKTDRVDESKQAIMKMEVTYSGDLQSQVAVLTIVAKNTENSLVNLLNETTGNSSAGPFLQNADFSSDNIISFQSVGKVTSTSITLSLSPKVYATAPEKSLTVTIKIYFDGKLADNQAFSFDYVSDGTSHTPKEFNYTVSVH